MTACVVAVVSAVVAWAAGVGRWTALATPPSLTAAGQVAVTLQDGEVLVAGGLRPGQFARGADPTAWLLDPASGAWRPVAPQLFARAYATATRLADGRVLVAGGYADGAPLPRAELFDPRTGGWTSTAALAHPRVGHTAILLPDGRVLVAGGLSLQPGPNGASALAAEPGAELYDPGAGAWLPAGTLPVAVWEHSATLLPDGSALVAGGRTAQVGPSVKVCQLFHPATRSWSLAPHLMATRRAGHTATSLPDGRVLVAGGSTDQDHGGGGKPTASTEIYDPATRSWTPAESLEVPRLGHAAVALAAGDVLVVGGVASREFGPGTVRALASAEVFDTRSGHWRPTGRLSAPESGVDRELRVWLLTGHASLLRLDQPGCGARCGQALAVGGDQVATRAQLFDPNGTSPVAPEPAVGGGVPWPFIIAAAAVAVAPLGGGGLLLGRRRR